MYDTRADGESGEKTAPRGNAMRVAHFVQRYPPALGGSESYFHRLGRYLADEGDSVQVFTSNAMTNCCEPRWPWV